MLKQIVLTCTLLVFSTIAKAETLYTDRSVKHIINGFIYDTDDSFQLYFSKYNHGSLDYPQHECQEATSPLKHRFFIDPEAKGFQIKMKMLEELKLVSVGYKCVDYKNWGVVPMIISIRAEK